MAERKAALAPARGCLRRQAYRAWRKFYGGGTAWARCKREKNCASLLSLASSGDTQAWRQLSAAVATRAKALALKRRNSHVRRRRQLL